MQRCSTRHYAPTATTCHDAPTATDCGSIAMTKCVASDEAKLNLTSSPESKGSQSRHQRLHILQNGQCEKRNDVEVMAMKCAAIRIHVMHCQV